MKKIAIIFAILSTLLILGSMSIMFDMGILPWKDKWLLCLLFGGLFCFGIYGYLESKATITYSSGSERIRRQQMGNMTVVIICTLGLILCTIFGLP